MSDSSQPTRGLIGGDWSSPLGGCVAGKTGENGQSSAGGGSSWEDHLEHVRKVLERFRIAGLTLKIGKCNERRDGVRKRLHLTGGSGRAGVLKEMGCRGSHYLTRYCPLLIATTKRRGAVIPSSRLVDRETGHACARSMKRGMESVSKGVYKCYGGDGPQPAIES